MAKQLIELRVMGAGRAQNTFWSAILACFRVCVMNIVYLLFIKFIGTHLKTAISVLLIEK